ncbi:MAG: TonB family protein [Polyangiales bacterium]
MFEDFQQTRHKDERRRFGGSMAVAFVLYGGASISIVAASATARHALVEEKLTQVEFATAPEPPPPEPEPTPVEPPPPPVEKTARPKVKRKQLDVPDEVPLEKPPESNAPLVEADAPGPLDGFTDGVEGAVGRATPAPPPPPPPPEPAKSEPVIRPVERGGNKSPNFPSAAFREGVEGTVVVEFTVLPDGRCVEPKIVSGPKVFYEAVLEAVPSWRFEPATQGGKKVPFRTTKKVSFRLDDA